MPESSCVHAHFGKRARSYNRSANWIEDEALITQMVDLVHATPDAYVLDLATGTGKLAASFRHSVELIVGIDLSPDMIRLATGAPGDLIIGTAEELPFENECFDAIVCRMGLQFMNLKLVFPEIRRVLKPLGSAVLCHLTAYGPEDRDTAFRIQELRNPARRNFFLPEDVPNYMRRHAFVDIERHDYFSVESVEQWINNGAIDEEAMEMIRDAYRNAPEVFKRIHALEFTDGDILDRFKMVIVKGNKPA